MQSVKKLSVVIVALLMLIGMTWYIPTAEATPQLAEQYPVEITPETEYVYVYGMYWDGLAGLWMPAGDGIGYKDGWGLKVNNTSVQNYGDAKFKIDGRYVRTLDWAYSNCSQLTGKAPTIPKRAKSLVGCFYSCGQLVEAPNLPESSINVSRMFENCWNLVTPPRELTKNIGNIQDIFSGCQSLNGTILVSTSKLTNESILGWAENAVCGNNKLTLDYTYDSESVVDMMIQEARNSNIVKGANAGDKTGSAYGKTLYNNAYVAPHSYIIMAGANGRTTYTISDEMGNFEVKGLEAGRWTAYDAISNIPVVFDVVEKEATEINYIDCGAYRDTNSTGTIMGMVVNENEGGIVGREVRCISTSGEVNGYAITNDSGNYIMWNIPAGEYVVELNKGAGTNVNAVVYANTQTNTDNIVASSSGSNLQLEDGGYKIGLITKQPDRTKMVAVGYALQLTIEANTNDGSELTCQWYKDGNLLPNQTQRIMYINSTATSDSGMYSCVVTGTQNGTIKSEKSVESYVFVAEGFGTNDFAIETNIKSTQYVEAFGKIELNIGAKSNTGILTYQWFKNGEAITGETNSELKLNSLVVSDTGAYWCVVKNSIGESSSEKVSNICYVTVGRPETDKIDISTDLPDIQDVKSEGSLSLRVGVTKGSGNVVYRWYKNGAKIEGAETETLLLENANSMTSGKYQVVAIYTDMSGSEMTAASNICSVTVNGSSKVTSDEVISADEFGNYNVSNGGIIKEKDLELRVIVSGISGASIKAVRLESGNMLFEVVSPSYVYIEDIVVDSTEHSIESAEVEIEVTGQHIVELGLNASINVPKAGNGSRTNNKYEPIIFAGAGAIVAMAVYNIAEHLMAKRKRRL